MAGKFEIKKSASGKYHFNLKASNGQTILSSEMYETIDGARNGAESVMKNGTSETNFERKKSVDGSPYFILRAGNGKEIGRSELYSSDAAMENGIQSVMNHSGQASVAEI